MPKNKKQDEEQIVDVSSKGFMVEFYDLQTKSKITAQALTVVKKGNRFRFTGKHPKTGKGLSVTTSKAKIEALMKGAK